MYFFENKFVTLSSQVFQIYKYNFFFVWAELGGHCDHYFDISRQLDHYFDINRQLYHWVSSSLNNRPLARSQKVFLLYTWAKKNNICTTVYIKIGHTPRWIKIYIIMFSTIGGVGLEVVNIYNNNILHQLITIY